MRRNYITTALLAAGLVTGCVNIKVGSDCKPKHHEAGESEDREDQEDDKGKKHDGKEHEGKESEDRDGKDEGKESKSNGHHAKESEDEDEKEEGKGSQAKAQAKLKASAKVSENDARKTAMMKVPNGTIKEGELEMENGKLQWSFDMSTPGSKDITEVNINAITGEVIGVDKETPADQAKEKDEEAKEKKEKD